MAGKLLVLLCAAIQSLVAQQPAIVFKHYTIDQGLSQNMVDCILKDSRGFMWFGTWNGLNRFDGYEFDVFKYNPLDSSSINSNFVYDICEDHYGNIWLGTDLGLNVYLFDHNRFKTFKKTTIDWIDDQRHINSMITDQHGNVWIGTEKGLYVISPENILGHFADVSHQFPITGLEGASITALHCDQAGNIWIGCENGTLFQYQYGKSDLIGLPDLNISDVTNLNAIVKSIYAESKDNLWIGTEGLGLVHMNLSKHTISSYFHNLNDINSLLHNTVQSIAKDVNGTMLFGTLGGLSIYNTLEGNFINYKYSPDDKNSISNNFVNSMYADENGYVWIGTERGGVNKYNVYPKKFESLGFQHKNGMKLSPKVINSIYGDHDYLWIGTAGGGLNRHNLKNSTNRVYKFDPSQSASIGNDFITSILNVNNRSMWIGTWGGGIFILKDKDADAFNSFHSILHENNSMVNPFVSSIIQDKNGTIWIGTLGGLYVYQPKNNEIIQIKSLENVPEINEVGCLLFDNRGNLWIGTIHGLFRIKADNAGQIHLNKPDIGSYVTHEENAFSISGNYVISIYQDIHDSLWFGTYGNGFNKLLSNPDNSTLRFKRYTEQDNLANNIVYCIQGDDDGSLWLSTDNGLSKFNIKTNTFNNYFSSDGLVNNQFYWSASFKDKKGKMYFGGMNGLDLFYPDSIFNNPVLAKPVFTGLKIYSKPVQVNTLYDGQRVLEQSIASAQQIVLSYKSKEFTIEFSALHYYQPEKNKYQYKLENFDKQWNTVDAGRRYATYSNLPGGEYTFRLKASNNDEKWGNEATSITIRIIPPFWETTWFRTTFILVIVGATFTYIRLRLYSLKMQKILLEKKVHERTKRIEEQKEELESMADNLLITNNALEKTNVKLEEQKNKVEKQNAEIVEQRDRLIEMNKKVQAAHQHRLHFFTNISHEFRTPLTLILSPLEQLVDRKDIKMDVRQKVHLMYKNARRLLNLISQLMELRKVETGKLEIRATRDDIVKFVTNISQAFQELSFKRNLLFKVDSDPSSIFTYFDHEKIENIVYNLLSNAFKYTPEEGSVTLEIFECLKSDFEEQEYIPIVDRTSLRKTDINPYICIKVSDSGIGVKLENIREIFKMFYREPSIEGTHVHGTGIGLSLVKELVKAHKGLLFAQSTPGKGSNFAVLLQFGEHYLSAEEIIEDPKENHYYTAKTSDIKEIRNNTIPIHTDDITKIHLPLVLIVEDNMDLRTYLADQLQQSFRIIEAINGKEGLEFAYSHSPDILISDIMMPEINGYELCAKIKANIETSHIPVILLTSKSGIQDHIEGFDAGADDYIQKPFNIHILESRIMNILKSRENFKKLFTERILPDPRKVTSNNVDEKFLKNAITIMNGHFHLSDFSVEKFASEMNMSRSLLHKKLVAIVGNSPIDFITGIRMRNAVSIMMNSSLNINEVAYKVGFNDPKYFSRCFKKIYGKTPTEYMKNQ